VTAPEQYTPRNFSALDVVAAAKRTADAILRANPLLNATVTSGLMQWRGNHVDSLGRAINFIWLGDFSPNDPTMGNIPQKGIVFRRDDSTSSGNTDADYAFALYDHDPGGGGLGLRQTLHFFSGDRKRLMTESRQGGQQWPEENVWLGPLGTDKLVWPGTNSSSFQTIWEGRMNVLGKNLVARSWHTGPGGAATEWKVQVEYSNGTIFATGPVHAYGVGVDGVEEDTIDVSAGRGETVTVRLMGRVTNGVGTARASVIAFRCFSP
jgi:hypothetical protein